MSTTSETAQVTDPVLVDLSSMPLREFLLGGDSPLDRVAEATVAALQDEIYAGFGNVPRAR